MGNHEQPIESTKTRGRWKTVVVRCLIGLFTLALVAAGAIWYLSQPKPDVTAFFNLSRRWEQTDEHYRQLIADAPQSRNRLINEYHHAVGRLADEVFRLADSHAGTQGQMALLLFLFTQTQDTVVRAKSEDQLIEQIKSSDLDAIVGALNMVRGARDSNLNVVNAIVARAQSAHNHPSTARLLARVSTMIEDVRAPQFRSIADTIVTQYCDSEHIGNFCEKLGWIGGGSVAGSEEYLPHLNTIFERNPHRRVRCPALFAIAKTHQDSSSESEQQKSVEIFQQFLSEFDGEKKYRYASVERSLRSAAAQAIEVIQSRGVGKAAIEIDGFDLTGAELRLTQFKGKVILLSFWASWCHPCLKMVPHEIELANEFKNQPFAIVGANGDSDPEVGLKSAQKHGILWPSFQVNDKSGAPISDSWGIKAWPTIVLIDADGVIRKTWTGTQGTDEIRQEIQSAIDAIID